MKSRSWPLVALLILSMRDVGDAAASHVTVTAMTFRTPLMGWTGGKGFILKTRDGGHQWTRQYSGPASITSFDFVNQLVGWALAPNRLLTTTDGGVHWKARFERHHALASVDFLTPKVGWGVSRVSESFPPQDFPPDEGRLARTQNGGLTWTSSSQRAQSVCFTDPRHGWVGYHNSVLRTVDGGRTWRRSPLTAFRGRMTPTMRMNVFASIACGGGGVWAWFASGGGAGNQDPYIAYRETSTGWRAMFEEKGFIEGYPRVRVPQGPGSYPGPFTVIGSRTAFFVGRDFGRSAVGIMSTMDGGKTWRRHLFRTLNCCDVLAASFADSRHGWVAGRALSNSANARRGEIFTTTDGGGSWSREYTLP